MDDPKQQPKTKLLGVWDTASLLIGIVVGVSIFKAPQLVFGSVETALEGLIAWGLGAVLSLCGALCFCELATTYPTFGGEYQFLSRAYGRRTGFLFAWMQLCVILTGSIGAMAFVFADYSIAFYSDAAKLFQENWIEIVSPEAWQSTLWETINPHAISASIALIALAMIHACGVRTGKGLQNFLTISKILALLSILVVGLSVTSEQIVEVVNPRKSHETFGLAMVFVLYAYGGWNDVAMVTPEVRDHQRNMPRALLYGLGFTAVLYLILNLVFLKILGFGGVRESEIPAADVMRIALGSNASLAMSLIVMCSALGAIHGMLFASCRLLAAVGNDYKLFQSWSNWNHRGVPVASLLTICLISLTLVLAVGTERGQQLTAAAAVTIGLPEPDWTKNEGGFKTLVAATAPVFWAFFAMSGFAVIVLRYSDRERTRPFRVPLYPLPVIIFCGSAIFMLWKSLVYAGELTLLSLPIFALGVILSFTKSSRSASE